MDISEAYRALVNNYRVLYGTVTRLPTEQELRQDRAGDNVVPDRETRQHIPTPRPSGPQYDGRQARSHCNKNG